MPPSQVVTSGVRRNSSSRELNPIWRSNGSADAKHEPTLSGVALLILATVTIALRDPAPDDRERGDVPGWVMITLMSAVLVAALLAIAGPALEGLFNQAIDQVSP